MATKRSRQTKSPAKAAPRKPNVVVARAMPRHAPFYLGLALGVATLAVTLWLIPVYAVSLASNALFVGFLALSFLKLPHLTADYLRQHAKEEDTPVGGIFLIVLVVVVASVVSLFLALNSGEKPDPWEVAASMASVLLGWFTVQTMGALHYAYEYYEARESTDDGSVVGGLGFRGEQDPDGFDFIYFSFTVGTSVATSDTTVQSHAMRRLVTVHLVFSHLYNTIILASAVNVLLSLGGGS
ncbi:DUF1345 domain-containing protein [Devosia sp. XJ19-1]|uniref:DUF1345 domain-containing protein n=1 Tax=Devosia ureilytica TaxID=2952754 RepID=A0A9Q4FQJ5_9HYPH|nr:DUF1345 domain-containing protein [Devosia ureilytica]MCP8881923.1 DUF1345 domain-containing protein [Devosia ureilytica]MCP8886191.1 DUF1345 domain-containing protein [Devosia ureilytica]